MIRGTVVLLVVAVMGALTFGAERQTQADVWGCNLPWARPDGLLILQEGTTGQFLVEDCGKRPFFQQLDLASHRLGPPATASTEEVSALGTGATIRAREGALFRYPSGSGAIYIIDETGLGQYQKRLIDISAWNAYFATCPGGYTAAIIEVTDANFLNGYVNGPTLYSSNLRPDGQLIWSGSGLKYLLEGGNRRALSSDSARASYDFAQPVCLSSLTPYPQGATLKGREGTLFKSSASGTQYVIERQPAAYYKRAITSLDSLSFFGLGSKTLYTWSSSEVNGYTSAAHVHPIKSLFAGRSSQQLVCDFVACDYPGWQTLREDRQFPPPCTDCAAIWTSPINGALGTWNNKPTTVRLVGASPAYGNEVHFHANNFPTPWWGEAEQYQGGYSCGPSPTCTWDFVWVRLNNQTTPSTPSTMRQIVAEHELGHAIVLAHDGLNNDVRDQLCGPPRVPRTVMDYDCEDQGYGVQGWDSCGVNHAYYDPAWGYSGC